jgi:hypothetical protein
MDPPSPTKIFDLNLQVVRVTMKTPISGQTSMPTKAAQPGKCPVDGGGDRCSLNFEMSS